MPDIDWDAIKRAYDKVAKPSKTEPFQPYVIDYAALAEKFKSMTLEEKLDYLAESEFEFNLRISSSELFATSMIDDRQTELLAYLTSPQFQEDLDEEIRQIHEDYGERMLEMAQMLCPVRTGQLQTSLYLEVSEDGVSIISDCEYFPFVEAQYHMVETAYILYEPLMLVAIDLFISSKLAVAT